MPKTMGLPMRSTGLIVIATILLLTSATVQARISHGISAILAIDTVSTVGGDLSPATLLAAIYPNPFNPRTIIRFDLAESGFIELAIYDLGGRLVRIVESGTMLAVAMRRFGRARTAKGALCRPAPISVD
jgi:hypothetical protein